jgi:hypothetical protein
MQNTTRLRCLTITAFALLPAVLGNASGPAAKTTAWQYEFHSVVPLGYDAVRLQPAKATVYLLASAESAGFEGMQRRQDNGRVVVTGANGEPVTSYPEAIDFRVTASAKKKKVAVDDLHPYDVAAKRPVGDYLLNLKFRLKIFRGLESQALEPHAVRLIGVPADVPFDERIYRVSFQLGKVSVNDRLVLEVLDADGNRVSRFHLEVL